MTGSAPPSREPGDDTHTAALLVVHGIGEQAPHATLDRVCRGLRTVLDDRVVELSHTTAHLGDRVTSGVRFDLGAPLPRSRAKRLDVFEGYWAPRAANLLSTRGAIAWLQQALLSPFRNWSKIRLDDVSLGRRVEIVFGELVGAVVMLSVVAAMVFFGQWYLTDGLLAILDEFQFSIRFLVQLTAGVAAAIFLVIAVRGTLVPRLGALTRRARTFYVTRVLGERVATRDNGLIEIAAGEESRRVWARTGWAAFVPLAAAVALLELGAPDGACLKRDDEGKCTKAAIESLEDVVTDERLWWGILLALVVVTFGGVVKNMLADVGVYTAEDTDSAAGLLRTHILASIVAQLRELLESGRYDTVHVLGHSLGSLISYDALNTLRVEVEHGERWPDEPHDGLLSREAYDRLGSLVTVACPLEHIDYLYRSVASDEQPIRDQLNTRRNGLRRAGAQVEAEVYRLDEHFPSGVRRGYYPIEPPRFAWLNVNASPDPVGTPLRGYVPDERRLVRFSPITFAHTKVMRDRRTYDYLVPYL